MLVRNKDERLSSSELIKSFQSLDLKTNETSLSIQDLNYNSIPPSYLPAPTLNFVGREHILDRIELNFKQNNRICILSSYAGTGKTTIANEFAYRFKENKNFFSYWLKSNDNNLDNDFQHLSQYFLTSKKDLEIKSIDDLIKKVNNQIQNNTSCKVLFIFDNCDNNCEKIIKYLTNLTYNSYCIVTTRDKKLTELLTSYNLNHLNEELEPFNKTETIELVKKSLKERNLNENDIKVVEKIIQKLGLHQEAIRPIVLTKLIANIKLKIGSIKKIDSFLTELNNLNKIHNEIIYKDDQLFLALIDQDAKAWNVLKYISFLDPDFIPIEILTDHFNIDTDELDKSVSKLQELSILNVDYRHNIGLKIHRSLQSEIQQYLEINSENELNQIKFKLADSVIELLERKDLFLKGTQRNHFYYQIKKIVEIVMDHNLLPKEKKLEISTKSGGYLFSLEKYPEAIDYLLKALAFHKCGLYDNSEIKSSDEIPNLKILISDTERDKNLATLLNNIGLTYNKLGKFKESLIYLKESLLMKQSYNQNEINRGIAISLVNIGFSYQNLGEFKTALQYYFESLDLESYLDNSIKSIIKINIGTVYDYLKDYLIAKTFLEDSLNIPKDDTDINDKYKTSFSYCCLGRVNFHLKDYDKAMLDLNKALEINEEISNENTLTGEILNNIGEVKLALGDKRQALANFEKALEIYKKYYNNTESLFMAETLKNLGDLHFNSQELEPASNYYKQALKIYQNINSENFSNIISYILDKLAL